MRLPASHRVLFLSDLHFGDGSSTDLFADQDERLIAFLEAQATTADTIVFLGDILDLPQAWTVPRIRRAHPALFVFLSRFVRKHDVVFVRGNHDWAVDYESVFPGVRRCEAILIGERTLAWHGHQVDLLMHPDAKDAPFKTYAHALAERVTRRRLLPPLEQFPSLANRVALSLAVGWSRVNLKRAKALRRVGRDTSAEKLESRVRYLARTVHGDPADIYGTTTQTVLGEAFDTVICGHTHLPGVVETPSGTYANIGTWTYGMRTYGRWTGTHFEVRDVDSDATYRDESYVPIPATTAPEDLFDWWSTQ